jgi:hypothetical protein
MTHLEGGIRLMSAHVLEELDARQTITRLVADLGVRQVLGFVADFTEAESDRFLMAGDRQRAARYMHDFRVVQRAVDTLRN